MKAEHWSTTLIAQRKPREVAEGRKKNRIGESLSPPSKKPLQYFLEGSNPLLFFFLVQQSSEQRATPFLLREKVESRSPEFEQADRLRRKEISNRRLRSACKVTCKARQTANTEVYFKMLADAQACEYKYTQSIRTVPSDPITRTDTLRVLPLMHEDGARTNCLCLIWQYLH